ncbi:TPA: hypothetical protein ACSHSI_000147 [Serratia marcescens]|nr:hypothetical protein [Serratia marcescens]WEE06800.1 hypothetical protein PXW05_10430 [Serratia marcescens]
MLKLVKSVLKSKVAGYVVGLVTAIWLGISHVETQEEAEKFAE